MRLSHWVIGCLLVQNAYAAQSNRYLVLPDYSEQKSVIDMTKLNLLVSRLGARGITMARQGQRYRVQVNPGQIFSEGSILMNKPGKQTVIWLAELIDLFPSKNITMAVSPGAIPEDNTESFMTRKALLLEQASQLLLGLSRLTKTVRITSLRIDAGPDKPTNNHRMLATNPGIVIEFMIDQQ